MDREFSSEALAELEKRWNRPGHLVEVRLDSGTLYLTDYFRDVAYGGNTYLAAGTFLGFDAIEESARPQVNRTSVQLSGVPSAMMSEALGEDFLNRILVIYKLFGRTGGLGPLIEGPIFSGYMDEPLIDEDPDAGTCSITVSAATFDDFQQRRGRHTNHEEQQLFFAGDEGFILATKQQQQVLWGRKA